MGTELVHTSRTLHRVKARPYRRGPEWRQHAGDTICGMAVDNGGRWCWCDGYDTDRLRLRECFFCGSALSTPDTTGER